MDIVELTAEEKKLAIKELYESFPTGREFEVFLNYFLRKLGFEEVTTTKYVGDNGIDLICSKRGLDPTGVDTLNYYVQAKRYAANNSVPSATVRDLKGTTKKDKDGNILACNFINVLITTSFFSKNAVKEAEEDPRNPTILIDGNKLIDLCIENQIAFEYKPYFNKKVITTLTNETLANTEISNNFDTTREISKNDIRARILPIPTIIKGKVNFENLDSITLLINGKNHTLNIDKSKRYLGGVTSLYKECGLITDRNEYVSKISRWVVKDGVINVEIN